MGKERDVPAVSWGLPIYYYYKLPSTFYIHTNLFHMSACFHTPDHICNAANGRWEDPVVGQILWAQETVAQSLETSCTWVQSFWLICNQFKTAAESKSNKKELRQCPRLSEMVKTDHGWYRSYFRQKMEMRNSSLRGH